MILHLFFYVEDEKDQEENASLGVYWLIKASSQGHKEATELLKQCLETGKGIYSLHSFIYLSLTHYLEFFKIK